MAGAGVGADTGGLGEIAREHGELVWACENASLPICCLALVSSIAVRCAANEEARRWRGRCLYWCVGVEIGVGGAEEDGIACGKY